LRLDGRSAGPARRGSLGWRPELAEVEEAIDGSQQVSARHVLFEVEGVEELVLPAALLTHHRCAPSLRRADLKRERCLFSTATGSSATRRARARRSSSTRSMQARRGQGCARPIRQRRSRFPPAAYRVLRGLVILTTNLRQNIDPTFLRWLRFIVEFPRPDVRARAAIWEAYLPAGAHRVGKPELGDLARRGIPSG
jgi:SpoVK/Ycf46/Vps4 family AAA+-type ATPase